MRNASYLTRRRLMYLLALSSGLAGGGGIYMFDKWLERPMWKLGTTFSQLQCAYLGLDYQEAFEHICSLGFDFIRLCSYWNEIEWQHNEFDFTVLDFLLDTATKRAVDVVLTVGMKAPRWPEFHLPDWIKASSETGRTDQPLDTDPALANWTLRFVQKVVEHTKQCPCIKYWQVENEPFNRLEIAAGRFLSYSFVQREITLTQALSLPHQHILLTNGINLVPVNSGPDEQAFRESLELADAVGINVYTKIGIAPASYLTPSPGYWRQLADWRNRLHQSGKEAWVTEVQAEPWEYNELVAIDHPASPSSSPQSTTHLARTLTQIGYSTTLLWGCEYWYWQKKKGHNDWWTAMYQLIQSH
jgi:Beta-galactosidase